MLNPSSIESSDGSNDKGHLVGVIADTHGLFDPAVRRHFRGVDHILHAGDIGDRSVIEQLEQIAPVTAVSGNIDNNDEQSGFPAEAVIELAGLRVAIRPS